MHSHLFLLAVSPSSGIYGLYSSVFPEQSASLSLGSPVIPTVSSLLGHHLPSSPRAGEGSSISSNLRLETPSVRCGLGSPCKSVLPGDLQRRKGSSETLIFPVFWEAAFFVFLRCCFQMTRISLQILKRGVILRRRLRNGNLVAGCL